MANIFKRRRRAVLAHGHPPHSTLLPIAEGRHRRTVTATAPPSPAVDAHRVITTDDNNSNM